MKRVKLIGALVLAVLAAVIVLQNMRTVEMRLLFARVEMPNAVLLLLVAFLGFALGILTTLVLLHRRPAPER